MPERIVEQKAIWVYIKLEGDGNASLPEFDGRWALEEQVVERAIGKLQGGGSGGGWMDFSFEVANEEAVEPALSAVRDLLREYLVPEELVKLEVVDLYEEVCDDVPDLTPGDCLTYRFDDRDFGAALVLQHRPEDDFWQTLLGVIDYKSSTSPDIQIFESRQYLTIELGIDRELAPFLVWVHCYGGIEVTKVGPIQLQLNDPQTCKFTLGWEDIKDTFIRQKAKN